MNLRFAVSLAVAFTFAPAAHARPQGDPATQPDDSLTDAERAVEIGRTARSLYDERRWEAAYDKFSEAEQVAHSPVFLLYMARCKRELGELRAARALYQRVIDDALPADAPDPWRKAQADADAEKQALADRMPRLRIVVRGTGPHVITLDGRPLEAGELDRPIELDPGQYLVEAKRPGMKPVRERVELEPGARLELALDLGPPAAKPSPQKEPTADAVEEGGSFVPGGVLLGFAGAAAVVGAVTGALALSKASDIADRCIADDCTGGSDSALGAALAQERDAALTLSHVSTASFVVAGVAGAVGVTLLILRPGASEVRLGPASLDLRVRF